MNTQNSNPPTRPLSQEKIGAHFDQQTILTKIWVQLRNIVRYDSAAIFLLEGDYLILVAGTDLAKLRMGSRLPLSGTAPWTYVFNERQAYVVEDVQASPRWPWIWAGLEYIRSWIGVPLVVNDNAIGIMAVESFLANVYTQKDAQAIQNFVDQTPIALEYAKLQATNTITT